MRFLKYVLGLCLCLLVPINIDFAQVNKDAPEVIEEFTVEEGATDQSEESSYREKKILELSGNIISLNSRVTVEDSIRFSSVIVNTLENYPEIEPKLVISIMHTESMFKERVISKAGARGLMQVMPFWAKHCKIKKDQLLEAESNIPCGIYVLDYYLDRSSSENQALCKYNGACQKCGGCGYSNKVRRVYNKIK